jgi:hypothetical protein
MHPDATYLPIMLFHANFIANFNADQVPTNLPIPTELLWTADYVMPMSAIVCLFCFVSFACSVLRSLTFS